jgi:hypothetical protein
VIKIRRCTSCKHYIYGLSTNGICSAFPEGIPEEIWRERNRHEEQYPGDNGIVYEPRESHGEDMDFDSLGMVSG